MNALFAPRGRGFTALLACIMLTAPGARGLAIEIFVDYDPGSVEWDQDPGGAELTEIVEAAASFWAARFDNEHKLSIDFRYADLGYPGHASLKASGAIDKDTGRVKAGYIEFDASVDDDYWWFDPTPADDDEFIMNSTVYGSLKPADQADFAGSPPHVLEVSYGGGTPDDALADRRDALQAAMHLIGLLLGFIDDADNENYHNETSSDGNVDFDPFTPGSGSTMSADVVSGGHFASDWPLMGETLASDSRERPSVTDILAIAKIQDYDEVNLPRRDITARDGFGGGVVNWMVPARWIGGKLPDLASDAYLRDPDLTRVELAGLSEGGGARRLFVWSGIELLIEETGALEVERSAQVTGGSTLNVLGYFETRQLTARTASDVKVDGRILMTGFNPFLRLEDAGTECLVNGEINLQTGNLKNNEARLLLGDDGVVKGDGSNIENINGGTIEGGGLITGVATLFNSGTIKALQTDLEIEDRKSSPGVFDLDGHDPAGLGFITAVDGSITFRGVTDEPYNGVMKIGREQTVWLLESRSGGAGGDFTLARNGLIEMDGGLTSSETAQLSVQHLAALNGTVTISDMTTIGAETIETVGRAGPSSGTTIYFDTPTSRLALGADVIRYNSVGRMGGTAASVVTPAGIVIQEADAEVVADTFLGPLNRYDWDGLRETSATTVGAGFKFHIDAREIDDTGDGFDGEITLEDASTLAVFTDAGEWSQEGVLTLQGAAVRGDDVDNGGSLIGDGTIGPDVSNRGRIEPGDGVGALTFEHDFLQEPDGVLAIELGGDEVGEYDVLNVLGDAAVDGAIEISLEGFFPTEDDAFDVVTAANVTDLGLALSGDSAGFSYEIVDDQIVRLLFEGIKLTADFDDDGHVDGDDLRTWEAHFGLAAGATPLDGDANFDGAVTGDDLLVWQRLFAPDDGAGAERNASIPEPAGAVLVTLSTLCWAVARCTCGRARARP